MCENNTQRNNDYAGEEKSGKRLYNYDVLSQHTLVSERISSNML